MTVHQSHSRRATREPSNDEIAAALEETAELLETQDANVFRIRAYRRAAETLRALDRPVADLLVDEGAAGLVRLPGIGQSLARTIEQIVHTGKSTLLSRLRGDVGCESVLASVPGIGPELARRIHEMLGIETLNELEVAAHDGRLARVPGLGRGRVRAVADSLAGRFRRSPVWRDARRSEPGEEDPAVEELLDVDREYRSKAAGGRLTRIAPRRFNPTHEAWLPILHTHRGDRHYTALYSNTARAHELGTTHDWVVIYRDDHDGHGRWTVVTSHYGSLRGKRIVRGREEECRKLYERGHDGDGQLTLKLEAETGGGVA